MNFNDDYNLIYKEIKSPDCIRYHGIDGVIGTLSTRGAAQAVEDYLVQVGYRVKFWCPDG